MFQLEMAGFSAFVESKNTQKWWLFNNIKNEHSIWSTNTTAANWF